MPARAILARQGDTVDIIAARCYGGDTTMTEAILDANPHLADRGLLLPHGHPVTLPERKPTPKKRLSLWD